MRQLYFDYGVRMFNFQDDNFFLPNPIKAAERFRHLRTRLGGEGVRGIAIAIKCRPDSVTEASVRELDQLGLFRVFLGMENASQNGLNHLNRKNTVEQILEALRILNDFDVHIAFNLLMFEPDTTMEDIHLNLRFMEQHTENPLNLCRAEAYAGTGLEARLVSEGRLLGDYFGCDYRLRDPTCEAVHQITNYAFFDRNFNDFGLHYFNMQVDFYFQLLRRFHPQFLSHSLRAAIRNFIKQTNLDTYECLCQVVDFVESMGDPPEQVALRGFARSVREQVDARSQLLRTQGERILKWLEESYATRGAPAGPPRRAPACGLASILGVGAVPCLGVAHVAGTPPAGLDLSGLLGAGYPPLPYAEFLANLESAETPPRTGC
jgi:hypothetical protein